jgi:microcystin-dependent protein
LFNVIGTFYGTVDGAHFNIPDLRGRTIAGLDPTGTRLTSSISPNGNTLGGVGGEQSHTLSTAEMPAHNHPVTYTGGGVLIWTRQSINFTGPPAADFDGLTISTSNTGGGGAHNNVQPTLLMNWIIKT